MLSDVRTDLLKIEYSHLRILTIKIQLQILSAEAIVQIGARRSESDSDFQFNLGNSGRASHKKPNIGA